MAKRAGLDQAANGSVATIDDLASIVAYLQETLGSTLTAVVAGVRRADLVAEWAAGRRRPNSDEEAHLRTAYEVATLLATLEHPDVIRAWFMGMNPELDDEAAAMVIARDPNPEPVMLATRAFLQYG